MFLINKKLYDVKEEDLNKVLLDNIKGYEDGSWANEGGQIVATINGVDDVVGDVIEEFPLGGNSGCKVSIVNTPVVRKISGSVEYNDRLLAQYNKQKNFTRINVDGVTFDAPEVFNFGYTGDGRAFFDMEYIPGPTLADEVASDVEKAARYARIIEHYIEAESNAKYGDLDKDISLKYNNKLNSILAKADNEVEKASCEALTLKADYPQSICHGDFTLENVIVKDDNTLYFIDFLDSFIDSYLVDVGAILQDSFFGWSVRKSNDETRKQNLKTFGTLFLQEFGNPVLAFDAARFKILRIIPYIKDDITKKWVDDSLKFILEFRDAEKC